MSYWLPLIVFIPHMIEEYPRFPAWATRHFGATSKAWYVYSHVLYVTIAVPVWAPRRLVWNATFTMAGGSRARWACGQAAFELVHMSTGRC